MSDRDVAPAVTPGRCSVHPNQRLVHHRTAGLRWYAHEDPETVCPMPDHEPDDRERCRWCGGPLIPAGTPSWRTSARREYCTPNHRLRAFRARERRDG